MAQEKGIWIITEEVEELEKGAKGGSDPGVTYDDPRADAEKLSGNRKRKWLNAEDLRRNMGEFIEVVEEAFDNAEQSSNKMQLDEIEVLVEVLVIA